MNLQELQTLKTNNVKALIVIINNAGYHAIRLTQSSFFPDSDYIGVGPVSNDLEFPSHKNIASAYDIPYNSCFKLSKLEGVLTKALSTNKLQILEVFTSEKDVIIPKSTSRIDEAGNFVSTKIHDMKPFLPTDSLESIMSRLTS